MSQPKGHAYVPVTLPNGQVFLRSPANPEEWIMIELQGELNSTAKSAQKKAPLADSTTDHLVGTPLGDFTADDKGKATFRIGNHLLSGTLKKLPKPLLVTISEIDTPDESLSSQPSADPSLNETPSKRLRVLGVVRSKYMFDSRPAPIVRSLTTAAK